MAFGKEIKRLRESAGITAAAMVKAIGIDNKERYNNWEKRDEYSECKKSIFLCSESKISF